MSEGAGAPCAAGASASHPMPVRATAIAYTDSDVDSLRHIDKGPLRILNLRTLDSEVGKGYAILLFCA